MHSSSGEPLRDSKSFDGGESTRPIDSAERARLGLDLPGRLGAFILGDFLGRGGMGSVYRARHAKTGAAAVLKLMPTIAPPAFIQSLKDEVRGLAKVNVPNIPRVLDEGCESGFYWMAQELIEGEDLRHFIARSYHDLESCDFRFESTSTRRSDSTPATSAEEAADAESGQAERTTAKTEKNPALPDIRTLVTWFRDLARALHAVHRADLLHRDIKPANIMLGPNQTPYLIDFGLSVDPTDLENIVGKRAGTPAYMSPEQASLGWSGLKPATDIYSLAVTFVEVLTGKRVVNAEHRYDVMEQIQFVPVPTPHELDPKLPDSLSPIFRRATQKAVTDRYASAGDLAQDLDRWLTLPDGARSKWISAAITATLCAVLLFATKPLWSTDERHDGRTTMTVAEVVEGQNSIDAWIVLGDMAARGSLVGDERTQAELYLAKSSDKMCAELIMRQSVELRLADVTPKRARLAEASRALLEVGLNSVGTHLAITWNALMNGDVEKARAHLGSIPADELALMTSTRRLQIRGLELLVAVDMEDREKIDALRKELDAGADPIILALRTLATLRDEGSGIWSSKSVQERCQADIDLISSEEGFEALGRTLQLLLSLTKGDFARAQATANLLKPGLKKSDADRDGRFFAGRVTFSIVANLGYLGLHPDNFEALPENHETRVLTHDLLEAHPDVAGVQFGLICNYLGGQTPFPILSWLETHFGGVELRADCATELLDLLDMITMDACNGTRGTERTAFQDRLNRFISGARGAAASALVNEQSSLNARFAWECLEEFEGDRIDYDEAITNLDGLIEQQKQRTWTEAAQRPWLGIRCLLNGNHAFKSENADPVTIRAEITKIDEELLSIRGFEDSEDELKFLTDDLTELKAKLERKLE